MSTLNTPAKRFRLMSWAVRIGVTAILLGALWPQIPNILSYAQHAGFHPHWPDMALFASIPPQVKFHIVAAVAAFAIGLVILLQPKGSPLHKTLGWAWVVAMGATAILLIHSPWGKRSGAHMNPAADWRQGAWSLSLSVLSRRFRE